MSGRMVMLGHLPWWIRMQVKVIMWLGWRPAGWPSRRAEREWKAAIKTSDAAAIDAARERLFSRAAEQ